MQTFQLRKYINRLGVWSGPAILLLCNLPAFGTVAEYHIGEETDIYRDTVTPSLFPILKFGIDTHPEEKDENSDDEYKIDAEFRISPDHPKAYTLSATDVYWGEKDSSTDHPFRISFGRRLMGWSSMDSMWGLGNVEPRDAWDQLRPQEQGLTGIFLYTDTQYLNFHLFASYVAIPELTPNVVIENNQFVSDNPQSISSAPQTFSLFNQPTPIGYQIDVPSISSILFRPSVMFSIDTKKNVPVYAKAMYGDLPLNYFPIALQGNLSFTNDQIPAVLTPILLRHQVFGGELAYDYDDRTSAGINLLYDQPESINLPNDYTYAPLTNSVTWSPWIKYRWPHAELLLSQLWSRGGIDSDEGKFADPASPTNFVSSHILYRNASQIALHYLLNASSLHSTSVQFKYLHEYSVNGDWIALDFLYQLERNFSVLLGGDVLSAQLDASPDKGAEFLSDVRALDRIRVGAQYAF